MSFGSGRVCRTEQLKRKRQTRAQWWFERMRQVVDRAVDWEPAPQARPEQIWFTGSYRQISSMAVVPEADTTREICE